MLIDEIEGFLQDRRQARCNWEVTGVNEMLTRMEGFPASLSPQPTCWTAWTRLRCGGSIED